ncbi:hypothetical protein ACGFN1_37425 [Streptomyces sp. NPDC048685]|uniref:hypothetical protein n=1 Tax=Streptomyces sp. NPDC048685 TaxID=3365584 RepID=UPI003719619E
MTGWKRMALIAASCVLIASMVAAWLWIDLGTADGVASVVGASAGVAGLAYAFIDGGSRQGSSLKATRTGKVTTTGGGTANTGISVPAAGPEVHASVDRTGDVESDGSGDANTGIQLT